MDGLRVIVIGAGMGGLAAAMRLGAAGAEVTVFDSAKAPGGKARNVPSAAGPVAAGPTVLTLRDVFDDLFADCGLRLDDFAELASEPLLARHFWPDGNQLDLFLDPGRTADGIRAFAGTRAAVQFTRFHAETDRLFRAFEAPVMRSPRPSLPALAVRVAADPALLRAMGPLSTLAGRLGRRFDDARLAQLFGRYSTYVGGVPQNVPALLSLVWQAEARGIWRVEGGIAALAGAMSKAVKHCGGSVICEAEVLEILPGPAVRLAGGLTVHADRIVFAGDPRALHEGLLGNHAAGAVKQEGVSPRSLSAVVHAFAAEPTGADLHHHNIFFGADPRSEFGPLAAGDLPEDPAIYVCAQDRGTGLVPPRLERFETIVNAAPLGAGEEARPWFRDTIRTLEARGLTFAPPPEPVTATRPMEFARMFPGSLGALYGRSPEGALASFRRPTAACPVPGIVLAGGGCHPGAGVPMAALSGRHAAETILGGRTSTSRSRRTATRGGTWTGSARTAPARSR